MCDICKVIGILLAGVLAIIGLAVVCNHLADTYQAVWRADARAKALMESQERMQNELNGHHNDLLRLKIINRMN